MHTRYNQKLYFVCVFIFYIMSDGEYNKSINGTVDKYIEIFILQEEKNYENFRYGDS